MAPCDYWLSAPGEKRFGSNEEMISETEVHFKAKDKLFHKKGIKLLKKRLNQCITLEGDNVAE